MAPCGPLQDVGVRGAAIDVKTLFTTRINKSAQSNLGRGPRRRTVVHVRRSPDWSQWRPKFALKSTPFPGPISKPHYLPHP